MVGPTCELCEREPTWIISIDTAHVRIATGKGSGGTTAFGVCEDHTQAVPVLKKEDGFTWRWILEPPGEEVAG